MMIGSRELIEKYGSPLAVAEALIEGKLSSYEQEFVHQAIGSNLIMEAAKIRVLNKMNKSDK